MANKKGPPAPTIPLDLWRELYQAAAGFQLLAPWQWMDDTHVFGINNEHGVRLVTVLGNMGEVFGLASYRGSAGATFLLRLRSGDFLPENPDARFYQDALLVVASRSPKRGTPFPATRTCAPPVPAWPMEWKTRTCRIRLALSRSGLWTVKERRISGRRHNGGQSAIIESAANPDF